MMDGDACGGNKNIVLIVHDDIALGAITWSHLLKGAIFGATMKVTTKGTVKQMSHLVGGLIVYCHGRNAVFGRDLRLSKACSGQVEALLSLVVAGLVEAGARERVGKKVIMVMTPHIDRGKWTICGMRYHMWDEVKVLWVNLWIKSARILAEERTDEVMIIMPEDPFGLHVCFDGCQFIR